MRKQTTGKRAIEEGLEAGDEPLLATELITLLQEEFRIQIGRRHLQKLRIEGRGPPFYRSGLVPIYTKRTARAWARRRLGKLLKSTADECRRHHEEQLAV